MVLNIPNPHLKGIFFIHFVLVTWSVQETWLPASFVFYNLVFMASLLWCMHYKESEEPVQLALIINVLSILLDIINLSLYSKDGFQGTRKFGLVMAILNLLARPFTSLLLYRLQIERSGGYGYGMPGFYDYMGRRTGPYENIDQPVPQTVPQTTVDTGSPYHNADIPGSPPAYGK